MSIADFIQLVTDYTDLTLTRLNEMGLLEEDVSASDITKVITLLKTLKLAKQTSVGPKNGKIPYLSITAEGRSLLGVESAVGGIQSGLVHLLVSRSPDLLALLQALQDHGPLVQPILNLTMNAPRKGSTAYKQAVLAGVAAFRTRFSLLEFPAANVSTGTRNRAVRQPSPKQLLDTVATEALQLHPVHAVKQIDKLVLFGGALGLLWTDTEQLNAVIGIQYVGSAAVADGGAFTPYTPTWEEISSHFVQALLEAQRLREDSTRFTTIDTLRGALGRSLHVSSRVADALICVAREAGERRDAPITVHFEEDEELMYVRGRNPILWRGHAFDFVEVESHAYASNR
ncbi:MAG: hypothetical protein ACLQUY_05270 [Ktedonobacterales bacterium]